MIDISHRVILFLVNTSYYLALRVVLIFHASFCLSLIGQHQQLRSQEHPDPGVRLQPVPDGRPPPAQGPRSLPGGGLLRLRRQTSDADAVQVDANYVFLSIYSTLLEERTLHC